MFSSSLCPAPPLNFAHFASPSAPRARVRVLLHRPRRASESLEATAAIETSLEIETLARGGLMPLILDRVTSGKDRS